MTTSRLQIRTQTAPTPAGTYSQAIQHESLVWIAGQTPRLPDGTRLNDAPFTDQARQTLRNVDAVAKAAGSSLADAVSVTVYMRDVADRFAFDEVWSEFVTDPFPARAVVQSDLPGFALEVSAVCASAGPR